MSHAEKFQEDRFMFTDPGDMDAGRRICGMPVLQLPVDQATVVIDIPPFKRGTPEQLTTSVQANREIVMTFCKVFTHDRLVVIVKPFEVRPLPGMLTWSRRATSN